MKDRMGLIDQQVLEKMRRPLELDLEAAFKAAEEEVMKTMLAAVKEGKPPHEVVSALEGVFSGE